VRNCLKVMPSIALLARMRLSMRSECGIGAQSIDPRPKRSLRIRHPAVKQEAEEDWSKRRWK
jgi:hypothetical protein